MKLKKLKSGKIDQMRTMAGQLALPNTLMSSVVMTTVTMKPQA